MKSGSFVPPIVNCVHMYIRKGPDIDARAFHSFIVRRTVRTNYVQDYIHMTGGGIVPLRLRQGAQFRHELESVVRHYVAQSLGPVAIELLHFVAVPASSSGRDSWRR